MNLLASGANQRRLVGTRHTAECQDACDPLTGPGGCWWLARRWEVLFVGREWWWWWWWSWSRLWKRQLVMVGDDCWRMSTAQLLPAAHPPMVGATGAWIANKSLSSSPLGLDSPLDATGTPGPASKGLQGSSLCECCRAL
jgi:hypothetical protein